MKELELTPWAREFLENANRTRDPDGKYPYLRATETDLLHFLAGEGFGYGDAHEIMYGCRVFDRFDPDWKAEARALRERGLSVPQIVIWLRAIYSPRHPAESEVQRLLFPEQAEHYQKNRGKYDARYRERHREVIRERNRAYYAANKAKILAARKHKRNDSPSCRIENHSGHCED